MNSQKPITITHKTDHGGSGVKQISVKTSMSDEINLVGNIMSHETQININGKFALPQLLYNFDIWETKF